jgi:DNA-binding transcriptional regulator PaaX
VEITDLNHKDLIALTIFFGTGAVGPICMKLNELGVEISESTVRARLSEMLREGTVFQLRRQEPSGFALTIKGENKIVDVTVQLTDEQLGLLA